MILEIKILQKMKYMRMTIANNPLVIKREIIQTTERNIKMIKFIIKNSNANI